MTETKTPTSGSPYGQEPLLREFLAIAREQLSLCADPGFPTSGLAEFIRLLSARRLLINRLEGNPGQENFPGSHTEETTTVLADLTAQIAAADSETRRLLQEKLGKTRQAVLKLRQGSEIKKAYTPGTCQTEGFYLDTNTP